MPLLAAQPGCRGVELGRSVDETGHWVLRRASTVPAYRRALQPFDVREHVVPLLSGPSRTGEAATFERCSRPSAGRSPSTAATGTRARATPGATDRESAARRRPRPGARVPTPTKSTIDTVVSLCKRRGFVFPCGEIYGGTRSAWDYGPLGVELKDNIKRQWWRTMVTGRDDVVGLDSSVILPRQVWVASGHVDVFTDPLVECLNCHKRFRADHLVEEFRGRRRAAARGRRDGLGGRPSTCRARRAAPAGSGPSPASST